MVVGGKSLHYCWNSTALDWTRVTKLLTNLYQNIYNMFTVSLRQFAYFRKSLVASQFSIYMHNNYRRAETQLLYYHADWDELQNLCTIITLANQCVQLFLISNDFIYNYICIIIIIIYNYNVIHVICHAMMKLCIMLTIQYKYWTSGHDVCIQYNYNVTYTAKKVWLFQPISWLPQLHANLIICLFTPYWKLM